MKGSEKYKNVIKICCSSLMKDEIHFSSNNLSAQL